MPASKRAIREWLRFGQQAGGHVLIVCDGFDYTDYPVYVEPSENLAERAAYFHGQNMQEVMECYDLSLPIEPQLAEDRAWHGWRP